MTDLLTLVDDLGECRRFAAGIHAAVLGLQSLLGGDDFNAGVVELVCEHHDRLDALYEAAEALHEASKPGGSHE
jgi:hypothetical protein